MVIPAAEVNDTSSAKLSDSRLRSETVSADGCGLVVAGHCNRLLLPRLMPGRFFLPRNSIHI
jgi:hypothetical protein